MASHIDVPMTFGMLMIGGIFAILFSGLTQAQTFLYFKLYPRDRVVIKLLVLFVWLLDSLHSAFITAALWEQLIDNFGRPEHIDWVPWSLSLTIAVTAVLTFSVHLFLIFRIFQLSKSNYFMTAPLVAMACSRLAFACLTTSKLVELRSLHVFVQKFTWSFTTGLTISTVLDIFITLFLVMLLRRRQQEYSAMNGLLDALVRYTFETGGVTTLATFVCLITWITMKHNLIFLGLHFVISKFYANSLLITLNSRVNLKPSSFRNGTQYSTFRASDNVPVALPGRSRPVTLDTNASSFVLADKRQGSRGFSKCESFLESRLDNSGTADAIALGTEVGLKSEATRRPSVQLSPAPTLEKDQDRDLESGDEMPPMQIHVAVDKETVVGTTDEHAPPPKRRILF